MATTQRRWSRLPALCDLTAVVVRERPEVDSVSVEFTVPMTLAVTTHSII